MERMSYALLIRHLPQLPGQTPRCEGFYKNRVLFSKNELKAEPFYKVDKELQNDDYILHAGTLHGITKGSEFSLYEEESKDSNLLGSFTVNIVGDLQSIVKWPTLGDPPQYLPMPAFAIQTAFGQTKPLRLYLSDDPKLNYLRTRLEQEIKKYPHLYCMASREEARFEIIVHKDEYSASFAFVNSHIETLGLKRLPFWVSLKPDAEEIIMNIVDSASMFNRFLEYQPLDVDGHREEQKSGAQASGEPISVHFAKLIRTGKTWNPVAEESDISNLSSNNQVDLVSHADVVGLKITNKTNEGLYPYLFLFNCNELTIEPWYTSPAVKGEDKDPPLRPHESITIGYNAGPGRPWRHVVQPAEIVAEGKIIREKEDMEVEFFKLILTTQPVNFDFIKQTTPFTQHPRAVPDPTPVEMRKSVLYTVVTVRTEAMYDETH
ncbi:hypothetical protein FRC17_008639 [Serendipita sp. 399]|nr:hypothetical protein FRC17_008639 [Serendipita sp. 399]